MTHRLSTAQLMEAFKLWDKGKDTHDIGVALEVPEHVVANTMREAKDRLRLTRLEAVPA